MHRISRLLSVVATCILIVAPCHATSDKLMAELKLLVDAVKNDKETRKQVIKTGREKALFCANCHGKDGNSVKPLVPNLAAQNPIYLLQQINNFASGTRRDYSTVMQQLAKNMSDKEKLALAVYYANVPLKPNNTTIAADDYAYGQSVYVSKCATCHGKNGAGKQEFARIGGQQYEYLKQVLTSFRDVDKNRKSLVMTAIVNGYSDDELGAIAGYVSRLKP